MFWLHFQLGKSLVKYHCASLLTTGWLCVGNVASRTNRKPQRVANWFYCHMSCIAPCTIREIGPLLTGWTGSENIDLLDLMSFLHNLQHLRKITKSWVHACSGLPLALSNLIRGLGNDVPPPSQLSLPSCVRYAVNCLHKVSEALNARFCKSKLRHHTLGAKLNTSWQVPHSRLVLHQSRNPDT